MAKREIEDNGFSKGWGFHFQPSEEYPHMKGISCRSTGREEGLRPRLSRKRPAILQEIGITVSGCITEKVKKSVLKFPSLPETTAVRMNAFTSCCSSLRDPTHWVCCGVQGRGYVPYYWRSSQCVHKGRQGYCRNTLLLFVLPGVI